MQRVVTFIEMRHYLALARRYDDVELAKKVTKANHFYVRWQGWAHDPSMGSMKVVTQCHVLTETFVLTHGLTNMVRESDPTSKILIAHYNKHFKNGGVDSLADLIASLRDPRALA